MASRVSLSFVSPCHFWAYVSILFDALTMRREWPCIDGENPPRVSSEDGEVFRLYDGNVENAFYDFMNLWIYDLCFWVINFTQSEQYISPRGGQMARWASLSFFLALSCLVVCIDRWSRADDASRMAINRRKNPPMWSADDGKVLWFCEFTILWLSLLSE